MEKRRNRYKELEQKLTAALIADAVIFFLFLLTAGLGIIWLKVIFVILAAVLSVLSLGMLYLSGEWKKPRSLWMTVGFAAILIVMIFSLMLNYPSPNKPVINPNDGAVGTVIAGFLR